MSSPSEREFVIHPDMVGRLKLRGEAMIADNATVIGDVRLAADVSIWFGVTIRGDDSWVEIGPATNVQDNTVVHVDVGCPQRIGRGVTIGHGVVLHGVEVGDHCLLGMNATVLSGARIGEYSIIGEGALVPEGAVIPPRSLVLGMPAKVRRSVTDEECESLRWSARHYVARARTYLAPQS
jgi:carbonic anhydrase/acetyltransferase-like protein (isoleucine patch superfamily)